MKRNIWFRIRLGLMILVCFGTMVSILMTFEEPKLEPLHLLFQVIIGLPMTVIGFPLAMVAVVSIQLVNPGSDQVWQRPTHDANPFHFGNPLLLMHFSAFMFLAFTGGILLASMFRPILLLPALWSAAGTGGVFYGLRLTMKLCRRKLPVEPGSNGHPQSN